MPSWIKRRLLLLCAAAAALPSFAQDPAAAYPKRPIRVVIGYSAGGGSDIVPRLVLERVAAKWGQPFIVENRPGASGHIATEIVFKAVPDGYTLLSVPPAFATTPFLFGPLPFDPDALVHVSNWTTPEISRQDARRAYLPGSRRGGQGEARRA